MEDVWVSVRLHLRYMFKISRSSCLDQLYYVPVYAQSVHDVDISLMTPSYYTRFFLTLPSQTLVVSSSALVSVSKSLPCIAELAALTSCTSLLLFFYLSPLQPIHVLSLRLLTMPAASPIHRSMSLSQDWSAEALPLSYT